jgi:hypothetical protein
MLKVYSSTNVPVDVAGELINQEIECPRCKVKWKLVGPRFVKLLLHPIEVEEDEEQFTT